MLKSWAPAQAGVSSFEKKGPKRSCNPPEIDMTFSNHGHQPKYEYHLLKRDQKAAAGASEIDLPPAKYEYHLLKKDLRTAADPPEIDLPLSNHGHQSKHDYHLLKRGLRTAANPPEIDLTLSNHGHQSKNGYHLLKRDLRTAANHLKLTCHFQIMGTNPNMNITF